jgi:hypothetical protein
MRRAVIMRFRLCDSSSGESCVMAESSSLNIDLLRCEVCQRSGFSLLGIARLRMC